MSSFNIQVNRKDINQYKIVKKEVPTLENLEIGQILVKVDQFAFTSNNITYACLLYTSPSPRDRTRSRMPSSA